MKNIKPTSDAILFQEIDNILWHDWDPIGVNNLPSEDYMVRDEYQTYIPGVFRLKKLVLPRKRSQTIF